MTTPTHEQILERAKELWIQDRLRRGDTQAIEINPEVEELKEEGFILAAQQELMRTSDDYAEYIEREYAEATGKTKVEFDSLKTQPFTVDIAECLRSGIFISGTSQTGKTTLGFHIAKRLMENNIIVFVIDPTQAWHKFQGFKRTLHIYPPRQKQTVQWNDETTLFDVSRLNPFEQQQFIETFSANVMEVAINRSYRPRIVVVFEEAHTPFYNGSLRSKRNRESSRLLTQGANFNIRFIAITQFASMVDKLVVKLAQQRYCGRTSEKNDVEYLRSFLGEHAEQLETLGIGEFLYFNCGKLSEIKVKKYETAIEAL